MGSNCGGHHGGFTPPEAWADLLPGTLDVVNDDSAEITLQYSTRWDALCHIGYRQDDGQTLFFNGFVAGRDVDIPVSDGKAGLAPIAVQQVAGYCQVVCWA